MFALFVMSAAALFAQGQPQLPMDLTSMLSSAGVSGRVVGWCKGPIRARADAYAAAVISANGSARYLVLDGGADVVELGRFDGSPEVSCYSPDAARKLNESIRRSETIRGSVTPKFSTTVVCGFVEGTRAVCWQYSAAEKKFVVVGGWET